MLCSLADALVCPYLEAEGVHNSDVDLLGLQCGVGFQSLMKSDSCSNYCNLVTVRLAQNLTEGEGG